MGEPLPNSSGLTCILIPMATNRHSFARKVNAEDDCLDVGDARSIAVAKEIIEKSMGAKDAEQSTCPGSEIRWLGLDMKRAIGRVAERRRHIATAKIERCRPPET